MANRPSRKPCTKTTTKNGCQDSEVGAGIFYNKNNIKNESFRIADNYATNQLGELEATREAFQSNNPQKPIKIITDSQYVITSHTTNLKNLEDKGWIGVKNANTIRASIAYLHSRGAKSSFKWIKGHSGDHGNEEADKLAEKGAKMKSPKIVSDDAPQEFLLTGAKLSKLTQRLATRGIREFKALWKPHLQRHSTTQMLDAVRDAVSQTSNIMPSDAQIWKSIRHKDFLTNIKHFMYKNMHQAYKIGPYWAKQETNAHYAICPLCDPDEESMAHIIFDCQAPAVKTIHDLASEIWKRKTKIDLPWTMGNLLGFKNKWITEMNKCLNLDKHISTHSMGQKLASKQKVLSTWSGTLHDEKNLPDDWTKYHEVLVGIQPWKKGKNR
ncbi:ribonuclease H-like protein [Flagelloscypha sp. PMI_526]|nr:ribonuclease H-like protein [Flagelloscypha sp. PMI_526]